MISKELLSEVLGYEALPTQVSTKELQYIDKRRKHGAFHPCRINIYELSHRCKEWALNKGYSYLGNKGLINIYSKTGTMIAITDKKVINWFDIYIDFKACEWILDNKPL